MARILLRCEDNLAELLDDEATRSGQSRNALMVALLGDGIVAMARSRLVERPVPTRIEAMTAEGIRVAPVTDDYFRPDFGSKLK